MTGGGKSSTAAHYASFLTRSMVQEHPAAVLYLSSPMQAGSRDYHLTVHGARFPYLRQITLDDFLADWAGQAHQPGALPFYLRLVQFVREQLQEHRPVLLVLDSIEELFQGNALSEGDAYEMYALLQRLARKFACTVLVPRTAGLHERHYSPLGRGGTAVGEFILTLHWHPVHAEERVITVAKNLRGAMGQQWHQRYFFDGRLVAQKKEPKEHVRPARSPATWKADPVLLHQYQEIIELVEEKMYGEQVTAVAEIQAYLKSRGYAEHLYRQAIARMGVERVRQSDGHYHLVPREQVAARHYENQLLQEVHHAERVARKKQELAQAQTPSPAQTSAQTATPAAEAPAAEAPVAEAPVAGEVPAPEQITSGQQPVAVTHTQGARQEVTHTQGARQEGLSPAGSSLEPPLAPHPLRQAG
ncbi:MAG TPA: hypothetical protein PKA06_08105 [Gemmatales bacterium]|nr:hypothetical protein [Gemmatales bacterium]